MKTWCILSLFLLLLILGGCREATSVPPASTAESSQYASSPYLLSVKEVAALLETPTPPLLLEISKAKNFNSGHLPGAINLWRTDYEDVENYPYGGMRAPREKMAGLLGEIGAKSDDLIVVYCTKGSADAARMMWILRGYGHERVGMMDGGKTGWRHAGHPLSQQSTPARRPTNYEFPLPEKQNHTASLEEMLTAISDTNTVIVDCREDYEYLGIPHVVNEAVVRFKKGASGPGAIPGAHHLNWSESVDLHSDHTFKPLADLHHNFMREGITPDKKIIVYCQSGVRSAHTTFVLKELLAYPDVKNYDGSWIEWSYIHAKDHSGKVQQHTSPEEVETIYHDLAAELGNETVN